MPRSFRAAELHRQRAVSDQGLQDARAEVDLPLAQLRGMDDDFADQLEACRLDVRRKTAEVDEAVAQTEIAKSLVARNSRLNQRQPGMVAAEDVTQAEAALHAARAHVRVKQIDLEEAELQCRKLERWRTRIKQILDTYTKVQ